MHAGRLLRQARARAGLTQRALARRSRIPQPMISAIERGQQDPRHSTLEKLLRACGQELDMVVRAGKGVDRTQAVERLRWTPEQRLDVSLASARNIQELVRTARRLR